MAKQDARPGIKYDEILAKLKEELAERIDPYLENEYYRAQRDVVVDQISKSCIDKLKSVEKIDVLLPIYLANNENIADMAQKLADVSIKPAKAYLASYSIRKFGRSQVIANEMLDLVTKSGSWAALHANYK